MIAGHRSFEGFYWGGYNDLSAFHTVVEGGFAPGAGTPSVTSVTRRNGNGEYLNTGNIGRKGGIVSLGYGLAFGQQLAVAVNTEDLGKILIVRADALFLGFTHLDGEVFEVVIRNVICNGRGGGVVERMGRDTAVILDSAHVYLVVGPVFIGLVYLRIFRLGYCRFPVEIGQADGSAIFDVCALVGIKGQPGLCPHGIVACVISVVVNGEGYEVCTGYVGRNVHRLGFSGDRIAFVNLLSVGVNSEHCAVCVVGVVESNLCGKGFGVHSADIKVKLGDLT